MKNYRITVNGNTYDVQVEELNGAVATKAPTGNILDIKVNVGDRVEANQCVVVLEAMKMENEIVTPSAGTVASVNVTKGQTVASGDVLITVAE